MVYATVSKTVALHGLVGSSPTTGTLNFSALAPLSHSSFSLTHWPFFSFIFTYNVKTRRAGLPHGESGLRTLCQTRGSPGLRRHVPDERAPVGQHGARVIGDVLAGEPDVAALIGDSGGVVAPAVGARAAERLVAAEAIVGASARHRNMDSARATGGVNPGVARARIVIRASHGKRHHTLATGVDANGGEEHIILVERHITLLRHRRRKRPAGIRRRDDEVGDADTGRAVARN